MNRTLTFHGRLPGVVCEIALPPQQEDPLRLDVTGFVGLAERGPLNIPVALHDIGQYHAIFGGDLPLARMRQGSQIVYANLQRAVQAFFDNGGRRCYVVRVAGEHATANQFRIPGLLAWDSNAQTLRPVVAPAAWPGRWSATMGVGTQLLSQPLPLAKTPIDWPSTGNFSLHVVLPTTMNVQKNDILRLHFDGPGKPLVYCYADTPQQESNSGATVWGFPVRINPLAGTIQTFSSAIQPLPSLVSVGKQQGNDCIALNVQAPSLHELPGLQEGYELHMPSTVQVKQADVLCIACANGEELSFPVEGLSQQASSNSAVPAQGAYVLTSRTPTWKLTPTLVERLTPADWVTLPVLLSAQGLEVRMARNDREYSLHLKPEDASKIQIGEMLRVTVGHGGQLLFPVSDVKIPPQPIEAATASASSSQGAPSADVFTAQVVSAQALWLFTPPAATASSPQQNSYGALQQVDCLTFNLYVRDEDTVVETWTDLRFGQLAVSVAPGQNGLPNQANTPVTQSWLDVLVPSPADLQKEIAHPGVVQRDIPGLDPTRSACLGKPNPLPLAKDGTVVNPLYFPLGMDDLPLPDEFSGPLDATSAYLPSSGDASTAVGGTDDLETFNPESLFLDSRLADVGYRDLINEANAILFASADVESDPFLGLHSLLFIDEVGIVALPDLPQRAWAPGAPPDPLPQPPEPTPAPPPDWSQFMVCEQPIQQQKPPEIKTEIKPILDLPYIETPDEYGLDELQALMRVQHALVNFCAARADVLGVMGLPLHFRKREVLDWQQRFSSIPDFMDGMPLSYVATYHPWLQVHEELPLQAVVSYYVPPDGAVCGMIAARELARGPWIAPANVPLLGVIGLSPVLAKDDWEALFNAQVNLVRQLPGQFTLMSAHTLSLEDTFLQISVRRLLIFLRKLALLRGMRYVFEANNERFRDRVQSDLVAALTIMAQRGGITAFEVITDSSINTQNDYDNGRFIIAIRVAPTLPIEFITVVLLRVGEDLLQVIGG